MSSLRILYAFQHHPPITLGGAEVGGPLLAAALREYGDVHILTPDWGGAVAEGPGLTVFPSRGNPRSHKSSAALVPSGVWAVARHVRALDPDCVLVNSPLAAMWAVTGARLVRSRAVVAVILRDYGWWCPTHVCRVIRGEPYPDCGTRRFAATCSRETMQRYSSPRHGLSYRVGLMARWAIARASARATARADVRVAVSSHLAETWVEREGSGARGIGSGVADDVRPPPCSRETMAGEPVSVAFMARGSPGKGAELLREAAERLRSADDRWEFLAWGDAGDVVEPPDLIRRSPRVAHDEALSAMASADLVVVPSVYPEALPRTAVEAQLVGTPVVVTPSGGAAEGVAPTGGVVTRATTAAEVERSLVEARRRLEDGGFDLAAAREWIIEHHSVENVAARLVEEIRTRAGDQA